MIVYSSMKSISIVYESTYDIYSISMVYLYSITISIDLSLIKSCLIGGDWICFFSKIDELIFFRAVETTNHQ